MESPWQRIGGSPITHSLFGAITCTRVNTELCAPGSQALALARSAPVFKGTLGYLRVESHSTSERCPNISAPFFSQLITSISGGKAVQGITFHRRECSSVRARLPDAHLTVFSSRSSSSSAECCICFCTPCLMFLVYLNTKILSAVQNWHNWF